MKIIALLLILSITGCSTPEDRQKWLIAGAVLAGVAVAYQAGKGGGYSAPASDYQWDWDQQRNQYQQLIWICRGVQTGQYAEESRCSGLAQTDWRWPAN